MLNKKGQLEFIELRFAIVGLLIGLILGFALIYLGTAKVIPFKIPFVCG